MSKYWRDVMVRHPSDFSATTAQPQLAGSGGVPGSMTTALFSDDPQVEELGKAGYDAAVAVGKEKKGGESDPPVVWLVNFYSPSCGHCQRFAPTVRIFSCCTTPPQCIVVVSDDGLLFWQWRRVGSRYAGTVIRVGAVDCINHRDICQSAGIRAFPTLKAFVPGQGALEIRRGGSPYENIENFVDENHLLDLGAMAGAGSKHVASSLPVLDEAVSQEANAVAQQGNNSASCRMRIVDASSSLKFLLENEVFVGRRSVLSQKERGG
jgi:thiol-disulfide isomerase/thioredoxin